jgi:hypothetical protein
LLSKSHYFSFRTRLVPPISTSIPRSLIVVVLCLLGCTRLQAETYRYKIGQHVVQLPTPQGFAMSQGLNPAFDQFIGGTIGSNKLLTFFTDQRTYSLLSARKFPSEDCVIFSAEYPSKTENAEVSEQAFKNARSEVKEQITGLFTPKVLENLQNTLDEATKKLAGSTSKLQLGKPVSLGLFEELPTSLVFGTVQTFTVVGGSNDKQSLTTCAIASINRAADRILFLSCSVPYSSAKDVQYALSIFKPWRDETLNLNPNSSYPGFEIVAWAKNSGIFNGVPEPDFRGPILGLSVAIFFGLLAGVRWLWKRKT